MSTTWGKVAVVAVLLVGVAGVMQMKRQTEPPSASAGRLEAAATDGQAPALTKLPRLLDLGSTSCIPCKMMAPILDELKTTYSGKLDVEFIDVWKDKAIGAKYGVEAIPTQIFFDAGGKELLRHTGYYSKDDIVAKLKELGIKL